MKQLLWIAAAAYGLALASCERDKTLDENPNNHFGACMGPERVINNDHITYMDMVVEEAPEIMDSFRTHTQLQAYKVTKDGNKLVVDCNVWARKEVQLFFAQYGLEKNLSDGTIRATQNNVIIYPMDSNFSYSPAIGYEKSFDNASPFLVNDNKCIEYTLGVFDEAQIRNSSTPIYTLVWKYEGLRTGNIVYIDAEDGRLVHKIIK